MPPSFWRQQQEQQANGRLRNASSGGGPVIPPKVPFQTSLDDLAQVAPFDRGLNNSGLEDLDQLSASLLCVSQAAKTLLMHPVRPPSLQTPVVPIPSKASTCLSKAYWHQIAQDFVLYFQTFHHFDYAMPSNSTTPSA